MAETTGKPVYAYKSPTGWRWPVPAQVTGERIEALRAARGRRLKGSDLRDDARPEEAVLHPCFTWDDYQAAEAWRAKQGEDLVRSIVLVEAEADEDKGHREVRAFVHIHAETDREEANEGSGYMSVLEALSNDELRRRLLRRALVEAQQWLRRYEDLVELSEVFAAIDRTKRRLEAEERRDTHAPA
jgi:hypothetical protein